MRAKIKQISSPHNRIDHSSLSGSKVFREGYLRRMTNWILIKKIKNVFDQGILYFRLRSFSRGNTAMVR